MNLHLCSYFTFYSSNSFYTSSFLFALLHELIFSNFGPKEYLLPLAYCFLSFIELISSIIYIHSNFPLFLALINSVSIPFHEMFRIYLTSHSILLPKSKHLFSADLTNLASLIKENITKGRCMRVCLLSYF